MATTGTSLYTLFNGKLVGRDAFGNRYYEARGRKKEGQRRKRWVLYKGKAEPSKVPAHWHTWLHYTTDVVPNESTVKKYDWQKEHVPNLTGTKGRYLPEGHLLAGGERAPTTADYVPWTPKS